MCIRDSIKLASKMLTEHTIGRTVDAHSEQFVAQNKINEGVQQDLSFNAREHNALKGRVQRTEQDVGKLEGEQGMAKNVIDTMRERDAAMAHQQSENGVARRPPRVSLYSSRAAAVSAAIPQPLKSQS